MKKVTAVAAPDCKQSTILLIFNRANQCRTDMAMRSREVAAPHDESQNVERKLQFLIQSGATEEGSV